MVSLKIHFRYWTSQNVLWFFYCSLLPLVFISHSVWSKATRAGRSGTRWTLGRALERWQRDKVSKFSASQTAGRFHRARDECSMNNTLSPKGKYLTQGCGNYWQSLLSVFLFAPLSLVSVAVCVSVHRTVSVDFSKRKAHASNSRVGSRRNEATVEQKTTLMRSVCFLSFLLPSLIFFPRHGSFKAQWHLFTCLCLIDLFLAEPLLRKDKRALYPPPLQQWHTRWKKENSATLFISVMPVGNKCLHTWVSSNGQFADGAREEARGREGSLSGASVGPRQRSSLYSPVDVAVGAMDD